MAVTCDAGNNCNITCQAGTSCYAYWSDGTCYTGCNFTDITKQKAQLKPDAKINLSVKGMSLLAVATILGIADEFPEPHSSIPVSLDVKDLTVAEVRELVRSSAIEAKT
jgi:hypothetical protein